MTIANLQTIAITGRGGSPIHTTSHLIRGRGVNPQHESWGYGFQNSVPVCIPALLDLELHVAGLQLDDMFAGHCRVVRSQNQHQHPEPRLEVLVAVRAMDEMEEEDDDGEDGDEDSSFFDELPTCVAVGLELFPCDQSVCEAAGLGRVRDSVSWEQLAQVLHQQVPRLMVEFVGVQFPTKIAAELLWRGIANSSALNSVEDMSTTRTAHGTNR